MNRHLVTVEVGIERGTDQRVQLNGFAFDQDRFERLNAQTVQSRRAVQHDRVLADDLIKDIPDLRTLFFDQFLGLLDRRGQTLGFKTRIDERFEKFERHLFRQTTLVQFQFRAGHNDRTAGKVDALTQEVLAETTLLAFQHV